MKKVVLWEKEDGIATITLNRPESLNAINRELVDQFYDTLIEIDRDWDVHVVILKGAGKAFCAGADVKMVSKGLELGSDFIYETMYKVQRVNLLLKTLRPPVIAAMHKYALGGGYEFAASCDFRFCTEDTIMGPIEIEVGLLPIATGMTIMPRILGPQIAKKTILTGDRFDARYAKEIGFVLDVVPEEKLMDAVTAFAKKLNSRNPLLLYLGKMTINRALASNISSNLKVEAEIIKMFSSQNFTEENVKILLEKTRKEL
nr:enoyl-CoA hydratase-related protein [Candidatus Freyarchaeota archaeon]